MSSKPAVKLPYRGRRPRPSIADAEPLAPAESRRPVLTIVLLLAGLLLWLAFGRTRDIGPARWALIGLAAAMGLIPPFSKQICALLERICRPSPRTLEWTTLLVGACAAAYFVATAFLQDRDLFPKTHDDCSYYLGIQMLAQGRLWMRPHPLADFFDSFYILTKPVYCSIYFPGTALMFVPTVWLTLPTWAMPVVASGAVVALLYRIVTELIDGAAGLLSALLLVSLTWFRTYSVLLVSQVPMLLLGLLMIWAWLRWRRERKWGWALAIGIFAGWAAITRPVDALCYAIPVGIMMALDLLHRPARQWAITAVALVLAALPFLALQGVFDMGVTGHLLKAPYTLYLDRDQPGSTFGFHRFNPNLEPVSTLPQKRADYELSKSYFAVHQPGNFWKPWVLTQTPAQFAPRPPYLAMIAQTTLPAGILLVLGPAALLALRDRRRWALFLTFPIFVLLYVFNPFFLEHYAIAVIPAVVLCVLLGIESVVRAWPRYGKQFRAALTLAVVMAAITSLWEVNHLIAPPALQVSDEPLRSDFLRQIRYAPYQGRSVVLFSWYPGENWKEEPVYNSEVAWPDDAEVIHAHDLGARDREIVDYYARVQPDRMFYVCQRRGNLTEIRRIDTAGHLREAQRQGQSIDKLLHMSQ